MAQVVDSKLAAGCVSYYQDIYLNDAAASEAALIQAYSSAITFPWADVTKYMEANPDCDGITMVLGVYTAEFAEAYGAKEGRLSLFLYATSSKYHGGYGNPVPPGGDPLNMGDQTP